MLKTLQQHLYYETFSRYVSILGIEGNNEGAGLPSNNKDQETHFMDEL